MSEWVIEARGLEKTYQQGPGSLCIFRELDFSLRQGESVGIVGSSGAGKTTLLNILGGLDSATGGSVILCGVDLSQCSDSALTRLRNQHLGFVYQFHHLLGEFSAIENVAMPLYIGGQARRVAEDRAAQLLERVGLGARGQHKPSELSGGERQRVAIARALVNQPQCVLMDEPTGNLDEATAASIQSLMLELQQDLNTSFVVVTHDLQLAGKMDRKLMLEQGRLNPG
ncbi:MAG: lipoprotein-releasing system ATP-binding protein LolD [Oleiphilus sp.]|nr:MAG: lipoprotein-releasing system ATP-binding protein LolD [Oleiphilus sp.]